MISNNLLNAVLEINYEGEITLVDNKIKFGHFVINLCEFSHQCKKWAFLRKFSIKTAQSYCEKNYGEWYSILNRTNINSPEYTFKGDSEYETVFKACVRVLKEIE